MYRDLPQRKTIRLQGQDYSRRGSYFITICVKDKHEILGEIVGDAAFGVPCVKLTETGIMVARYIENMRAQKGIKLDKYVIMPNHIHLILFVETRTPKAAPPTKATIPQTINALKGLTSKKFGESMWQRSYHDHIIRSKDEYEKIRQYIVDNPKKWIEDQYYPEQIPPQ